MKDVELLRAIYRSIDWQGLCRRAPKATRQEVDKLFARFSEMLKGSDAEAPKPRPGLRLKEVDLYCDGASRGNAGPAAIGVVLRAPDGQEILAWGEAIGEATSNVAEYRALIAGLSRALGLGVKSVRVFCDSQLVVRQLNGVYRVKSPALRPLFEEAQALLKGFASSSVVHVPRGENQRADALAAAHINRREHRRPRPRS